MNKFYCEKCDRWEWGRGIDYKGKVYCSYHYKEIRYKEVDEEVEVDDR